jgi:hypothetical protein
LKTVMEPHVANIKVSTLNIVICINTVQRKRT